jgi:hypothetical protein
MSTHITGFNNLNSICYFNSVIQCLISSKYFIAFITSPHQENDDIKKRFKEFLSKTESSSNFPTELLISLNLLSPNECSLEYLSILIDKMKCEDLFKHERLITLQCDLCGDQTYNKDKAITSEISNCFGSNFVVTDVKCDKCKKTVNKTCFSRLSSFSDIFALYKRKNSNYPIDFTIGAQKYILFALIIHYNSGSEADYRGSNGGHYIAVVKRNNLWYIIDDNKIQECTITPGDAPFHENTFILFYEKSTL